MKLSLSLVAFALVGALEVFAQDPSKTAPDKSPHPIQFVDVEKGVRLEVLDWGGQGLPLVFLAGAGFDGRVFDDSLPSSRTIITFLQSPDVDSERQALRSNVRQLFS